MELRIQKELYKMAIEHEWLFTRSEKFLLKLAGELAQSTGELVFLLLFCCWGLLLRLGRNGTSRMERSR